MSDSVDAMQDSDPRETSALGLPRRPELPIFVYGTLMRGQPGHHQIERFNPSVKSAQVKGSLYVRDGLPLLGPSIDREVCGELLEFPRTVRDGALGAICLFEPRALYSWVEITTVDGERANTLYGKSLQAGNPELIEGQRWVLHSDPVFSEAMRVVRKCVTELRGEEPFPASPGERLNWERAFRFQMAYLLLWSVFERFSSLAIGPGVTPNQRVAEVGKLEHVQQAIKALNAEERQVRDSRNPTKKFKLNVREAPQKALDYYYAVRSNLTHRGKSAWNDANTVRQSLMELLFVLERVLATYETGASGAVGDTRQ